MQLLGYAPDLDPTTPGVLKSVSNVVPTKKGFRPANSLINAGLAAVSSTVNSLVVVEKLDGERTVYVGTDATLEEAGSGTWTDRSRVAGYTCGDRWSFAQFGDITLAANVADLMQFAATGDADFADIAGAPQAKYIAVCAGFVMAVNLSSSTDGWHCSAYLDYTDWIEAVSTQCTSGRLVGGGAITGIKKLGSGFLVFKKSSMYLGQYVGSPVVWQWDEIPGDVGCPDGNAAVDIGDRIAFLGNDSFYVFDGARAVDIGEMVREWFFQDVNNSFIHKAIATYNPNTGNATWYYPSKNSDTGTPDTALVYNVRMGKWGKFDATINAAAKYFPPGVVIDSGSETDLADLYATIDDANDISFDSPYWTAAIAIDGVIKTSDNKLYTLTGTPGASSMTINTIGNDDMFSTVTGLRPRFLLAPDSSSLTYAKDDTYGDSFEQKRTYPLSNGKYDLLQSARWHQITLNFNGDYEILSVMPKVVEDGYW